MDLSGQFVKKITFTEIYQGHLGFLAHVLESLKNVFNFSVPFISWLAFFLVFVITIVLYYVPIRYVWML